MITCCCNGCVYWARIQDGTQSIEGRSYYACASCWALNHDASDQRTPVLPPSRLVPMPQWHGKVPRVTSIRAGAGSAFWSGRVHGREDRARPWAAAKKVRMHTEATNQTTDPPSDGACWVPEGR